MNTQTETNATPKTRQPLNGVQVQQLFDTIGAVKAQPVAAAFTFRASNKWIAGTHSVSKMEKFDGAGGTHEHISSYEHHGDHPAVLCGADQGPTPVEYLLTALAACITAGIGNIAAARGVTLESVESIVEGDVDLQGLLGLNEQVRNGYQGIRIRFKIKGDASAEKLRAVVEQSRARSAVFDVLTNGCPVSVDVEVA